MPHGVFREQMREFADHGHGTPATVKLTVKTLREYAEELERIADGEFDSYVLS
jgi:hypothetical protein